MSNTDSTAAFHNLYTCLSVHEALLQEDLEGADRESGGGAPLDIDTDIDEVSQPSGLTTLLFKLWVLGYPRGAPPRVGSSYFLGGGRSEQAVPRFSPGAAAERCALGECIFIFVRVAGKTSQLLVGWTRAPALPITYTRAFHATVGVAC